MSSIPFSPIDPDSGDAASSDDGSRAASTGAGGPDHAARVDALFHQYYARLCDFVCGLVDSRDAAEDIVQDVFVRLWGQRHALDLRNPAAYLYHAARNGASSYARGRRTREAWVERARAEDEGAGDATAEGLEFDELTRAVRAAVADLPERCRLCFTLSRDHGLSYAEVARTLGISTKTVEIQIGRAIKAIRARVLPYLAVAVMVEHAAAHIWGTLVK